MKIIGDIWNTLKGLVTFIIHTIETIGYILGKIPEYMAIITNLIAEIPTEFQAIILATIAVSIIYLILGRNNG